mmetsp:Transcript_8854/g.20967  ORF Transcript_8854/g.20967 Transcript_8854/m.20967 type:complete len:293 (-) Transcript_8854:57-935(-)
MAAVTDAQDEVTRARGVLNALDRVLVAVVELQDVAQQEGEGDADARFLAERGVREGDADLGHGELRRRLTRQRADPAHEANVGERVPVVGRVVHDDGGVILEGAVRVPVERAKLQCVARAGRGRAPRPEHRAVALRELADEVDAAQVVEADAGAVGDAVHLLVEVRARVVLGEVVREVKGSVHSHLGDPVAKPRRQPGQRRLHLSVHVLHGGVDHLLRLGLQQRAVREAHLVRRAVHVQELELVAGWAGIVQLAIGHRADEGGRSGEQRVRVRLRRRRRGPVAVGRERRRGP